MTVTESIREWAKERKLDKQDPRIQLVKLTEEVGELCGALLKGKYTETIDGIGDVYIVLTILAAQLGFTVESCIDYAYHEIRNRTGKTENGVFIKDEPK